MKLDAACFEEKEVYNGLDLITEKQNRAFCHAEELELTKRKIVASIARAGILFYDY